MKLNKRLLVAALTGAVVVSGGANTHAADEGIPKGPEYNDPTMFELPKDYNGPTETTEPKETETTEPKEVETTESKETETKTETEEKSSLFEIRPNDKFVGESAAKLQGVKDEAKEKLKANGIALEFYSKQADVARNVELLNSFVKMLIDEYYKLNPDALRSTEKAEGIEEPGDNTPEGSPLHRQTPSAYGIREEAEEAAKKALESELLNPGKINSSYEVVQKPDGNWDYVLKIVNKSEEQTPERPLKPDVTSNPLTPEVEEKDPVLSSYPRLDNHYFMNDDSLPSDEGKTPGKEEKPGKEGKPEQKPEQKPGKEEKLGKEERPAKEDKRENKKKENTDSPNKKKKEEATLSKAGSEAKTLTLAVASLSSVAGAFILLKKRK